MSQYPSPYNPPTGSPVYGYAPVTPDVLAASRRAGLLMFFIGGLTMLLGTCVLAVVIAMPAGQLADQMQQSATATGQSMPFPADMMKNVMVGLLVVMLIFGAGFIVLGVGVRRGGRGSTFASLIVTALVVAFLGLQTLGTVAVATKSPGGFAVACIMFVIPLSLLVLLVIWLIGALKSQSKMRAIQQQYSAQYWQYQQNMQAYYQSQQQQGYATDPQPQSGDADKPTT